MLQGDRLKELRESKGYTHQQLAEFLDLGTTQIWRYETGKTDPAGDILARIAKVFNVSVDYLLGLTDEATPPRLTQTDLSAVERDVLDALRRGEKVEAIKLIVTET
jgi:transcriptional regulator with XRE-family HTH domain